jgi:hypothetical protein
MPEIRQVPELYTNHQFFLLFFSAAHAASSNQSFNQTQAIACAG